MAQKSKIMKIETQDKQLRNDFEKILEQAEKKYDKEVTILLKAIDLAEEMGDVNKLRAAQNVAINWIVYFNSLRDLIGANYGNSSDSKATIGFIDDQRNFFRVLAEEIDRKVIELASLRYRQVLE